MHSIDFFFIPCSACSHDIPQVFFRILQSCFQFLCWKDKTRFNAFFFIKGFVRPKMTILNRINVFFKHFVCGACIATVIMNYNEYFLRSLHTLYKMRHPAHYTHLCGLHRKESQKEFRLIWGWMHGNKISIYGQIIPLLASFFSFWKSMCIFDVKLNTCDLMSW